VRERVDSNHDSNHQLNIEGIVPGRGLASHLHDLCVSEEEDRVLALHSCFLEHLLQVIPPFIIAIALGNLNLNDKGKCKDIFFKRWVLYKLLGGCL